MNDLLREYGLRRVINLSAKETAWGASQVPPDIAGAALSVLPHNLDMAELHRVASARIAPVAGGEAAFVTGCCAAGIAISVAGCMTGTDLARVEQLPDTAGMKHKVVMQKGHECHFGARVSQMIRMTGAEVVEAGTSTDCARFQVDGAIDGDTAAGVFVISHHTVQVGLLDLAAFCDVCHARGVPVIVDAAGEYDWPGILRHADLVCFSAHKTAGGLTAGIVAGREELVRAAYFQERGIGRPMKAGKEGIVGAMAAMARWAGLDHAAEAAEVRRKVGRAVAALSGLRGVTLEQRPDTVGQPVVRAAIHVDPAQAGLTAFDLSRELAAGDPKIVIYNLHVDRGYLLLDVRNVDDGTLDFCCARIRAIVESAAAHAPPTHPPARHDLLLESMRAWPHASGKAMVRAAQ